MKKKILVIGANGFIASNLIRSLKQDRFIVVGAHHSNVDRLDDEIENIAIDDLYKIANDFDVVFLLSAFIPRAVQTKSDRLQMFEANVTLVDTICKMFTRSRIIYASSVSVYKSKNNVVAEHDNEGGLNEYGVSKLWGEKIVTAQNNFAIVRLSSVYGVGMNLKTIIPNYVLQAITTGNITVWGNGTRMQNYIHVEDVVNFLKRAALLIENEVLLATANESVSNSELAEIIASKTGCAISFLNEDSSSSFLYDNSYSKTKLNYTASISIDEGIEELIQWLGKGY